MCMSLNEIAIAIVACLRLADGYVDLQRIGFLYIFIHFYIDDSKLARRLANGKVIFTESVELDFAQQTNIFPLSLE